MHVITLHAHDTHRAACARRANVTEFPAGFGHNHGLQSVTSRATKRRTTYGGGKNHHGH